MIKYLKPNKYETLLTCSSESWHPHFENSSFLEDHFQQNETGFQLQQLSLAASVGKTDDLTFKPRQPGSKD